MQASEKLSSDSDLFGLPGNLHVIKVKLDRMKSLIDQMEEENKEANLVKVIADLNDRVIETVGCCDKRNFDIENKLKSMMQMISMKSQSSTKQLVKEAIVTKMKRVS